MSDPRLTLMHDGLAAAALEGVLEAREYRQTSAMRCIASTAPIREAPDTASQQQDELLFGEGFDVLLEQDGHAFGQARRDGYVGWVQTAALAAGVIAPTHWVRAPATFSFPRPDYKSTPLLTLPFNALVCAGERDGRFVRITDGSWVFEDHLAPVETCETDPVAMLLRFEGAPYLWGGRTLAGADCSGIVQAAAYACGLPSARDSDMQAQLGRPIEPADLKRGDLVFWDGHVGMITGEGQITHATAGLLQTASEPLADVVERMAARGGGQPTGYRRL